MIIHVVRKIKLIIACIVVFWFGLFLGYYAAYFYYGGKMDISGTAFANIGIWLGSLATTVTFAFLILQNNNIRKQQQRSEKRQEQFEERQNELWESQQVKIKFEMYQAHKKAFFNVLDDIEKSSPMDVEFYDREKLYRRTFPMNSFSNVEYEVKIGDEVKYDNGNFTNINEAYTSSIQLLNSLVYAPANFDKNDNTPINFIHSLLELTSNLQLIIKPNGCFGDVTFEN